MPATLPRIDQETLAGIRVGDERSLERLFRDSFSTLTQEAAERLDDRTSAARVVEGTFRAVWEDREKFDTPEALERFIHSTLTQNAIRENKRLATLHRFEAGAHVKVPTHAKHEPTVDESWAHLAAALHAPDSPEAHAAARAQATQRHRHDAAEHVAGLGKRRISLGVLGLGIALALLIGAPLWYAEQSSDEAAARRALASSNVRVVSTVIGQQAAVELLDGSSATLGADSKLTIAPDFGTNVRAVGLEGSAMFEVRSGQRHPFQVRAGDATIMAEGTTFGVRAYPDDSALTVGVRSGRVTVKAGGTSHSVDSGRVLIVAKDGTVRESPPTAMEETFGWAGGKVAIGPAPLRAALPELRRWFALDIRVPDSTLLQRVVTVRAELNSPRDAIAAIEQSGGLKFDYEGQTMVLRDNK